MLHVEKPPLGGLRRTQQATRLIAATAEIPACRVGVDDGPPPRGGRPGGIRGRGDTVLWLHDFPGSVAPHLVKRVVPHGIEPDMSRFRTSCFTREQIGKKKQPKIARFPN